MHQRTITVSTRGKGFSDITRQIADVVRASGVGTGLCSVFVMHTSASLVIQENADPAVLRDLERFMSRLVPEIGDDVPTGGFRFEHNDEGPDDMPAHIRSALTKTSETLPVEGGRIALGTWQAVYLWEHRRAPHERRVVVTVVGESL